MTPETPAQTLARLRGMGMPDFVARVFVAEIALRAVLNSDMAMREEDEGQISPELEIVRDTLAAIVIDKPR